MASSDDRDKNLTRPKKRPGPKRRRQKTQARRLVALGMAEEEVAKLNTQQVRALLRHPLKVAQA